jgi:hypothetical protein
MMDEKILSKIEQFIKKSMGHAWLCILCELPTLNRGAYVPFNSEQIPVVYAICDECRENKTNCLELVETEISRRSFTVSPGQVPALNECNTIDRNKLN